MNYEVGKINKNNLLSPVSCLLSPVSCLLSPVSCLLYLTGCLLIDRESFLRIGSICTKILLCQRF
ncbi:MAG: hypothetical protein EWV41_13510 [Microcystis wesenbergii Mw_MB_S_20031200_S109]|uniref:Uncharacterized protein n=1 Tax=Microcystis wesenbergii Mw_MB_S_20031200_S109D TaxID=2486241 RepID=A0A552M8C3_9CHRO|nr:MAG: hypothetical protein EWV41_13510 [Microcystis wesenbergii Mw_MB_S_20031200_S109]TRV28685.1 MAG: hypothetical protein EWV88_02775 [Microcystis wesenbergii Mw_MB_S_20031200_S109D]